MKKEKIGKSHLNVWKIIFTISILCLFLSANLKAIETEHPKIGTIYRGLEYSFALSVAADTYTTFRCIDTGKTREANPIAALYIDNKPLAVIINAGVVCGVLALTRSIHKCNRTLATVILIALNVIEYSVVVNNIRVERRVR